jgi:O-acetyl-ADP-ribose deacetylase (regulator of RNase III)
MKITIVDRNRSTADVFRSCFATLPDVSVACSSFEQLLEYDCVVTAGNSFGLMDAGMDLAVVRYFGRIVMERVQERILREYLGEQHVGTSIIVPTGNLDHPFVAHSPTMRVPMNIN